jgi:hypothetical protein
MMNSNAYGFLRPTALALLLAVTASVGVSACGDDEDSVASDGGTDDGGDAEAGDEAGARGGKAGSGGNKASAGKGGAGEGGDEEAAAGEGEKEAAAGEGGEEQAAAGEGGSEQAAGGEGGAESAAGASSTSDLPAGVTLTGVVVDITDGTAETNFDHTKYPAVAGAKVCVYENDGIPCTTTDADGKYSLGGLPEARDFYLSYEKDSLAPTLFKPVAEAGNELPAILMTSSAYRDSFLQAGGVAPDENAGLIYFGANLLEDRRTPFHQKFGTLEIYYLRGYAVSIEPAAKTGPVYVSESWTPDASLKASSPAGWGIFQAVPGDYTLSYAHPVVTCPPTTTKVAKGWTTLYVRTTCSAAAADSDAGI